MKYSEQDKENLNGFLAFSFAMLVFSSILLSIVYLTTGF